MKLDIEPLVQLKRINVYTCERCPKIYSSLNDLNKHVRWHDLVLDTSDAQVLKHMLSARVELHTVDIFKCGDCTRGFLEFKDFHLHQLKHSNGAIINSNGSDNRDDDRFIKNFKCDKCDSKFVAESTLIAHSQVHVPFPHICECGIGYYVKKDLIGHRKLVHPQEDDWKPKIEFKGRKEKIEIECDIEDKDVYKTKLGIRPRLQAKLLLKSDRKPKSKAAPLSKTRIRCTKSENKSNNGIDNIKIECNDDGRFLCPMCGKTFKSKRYTLLHLQIIHGGLRPYECKICHRKFSQNASLKQHLKRHAGIRDHACKYCTKSFYTYSSLILHERVHTGVKPYECSHCGKPFADRSAINRHERTHTGYHPYKCEYCPKTFSDVSALHRHRLIHQNKKDFECKICNRRFYTISILKHHIALKHVRKAKFECDYCGKCFTTKPYLINHMMGMHLSTKDLQCCECDKKFCRITYLDSHFKRVHKRITRYECTGCDFRFVDKHDMKKHFETIHSKILDYACDECPNRYSYKESLKDHIHTKHSTVHCDKCRRNFSCKSELKEHKLKGCEKCSVCDKAFPCVSTRNQHVKNCHVNKNKIYDCAHCFKRFYHRRSIINHYAVVHDTSKRKFECDYCGEKFPLKSKVKEHIYKKHMLHIYCNKCHKRFYSESELTRHKKQQKNCAPTVVECDICGKKLSSKRLEHHMKKHSRTRKYECDICGQEFIWKWSIVRHMDLVHKF